MLRFFYILLMIALLFSCKPYKSLTIKPGQKTYTDFRLEQQSFKSSDGIIKYIDKGQGDVILMLHGVPTSGWLYRNMIDELAKTHRVIVPDMLGFGSSDSPEGYEVYNEENHARRLLDLMEYLKIDKWHHAMHDAGGLWTLELIKKAPSKIKKLIIFNIIISDAGFNPPIRFEEGGIAKTAMWSYRNGITTNMMLKGLFRSGLKKNNLNKLDVEGYKTPLLEGKTSAMYYFFTQTCNELPTYTTTLDNLDIPVYVIWGEEDEFLLWNPQKEYVKSHMNISEENVHILDAKHFIQEEEPEKIVEIILQSIQ